METEKSSKRGSGRAGMAWDRMGWGKAGDLENLIIGNELRADICVLD